jgi:putative membrane-bound dehydrogenase-like protein
MSAIGRFLLWMFFLVCTGLVAQSAEPVFRAGAARVDIGPEGFPVRVNAMFTERSADRVEDPLFAKALALDDGRERIVVCVVDTCMIPRNLIDQAKLLTHRATGLPLDRMLVSATHTHSAPSAMGCLGSRVDPRYATTLPPKIARAMIHAIERLQPARVGWGQVDDWEHTFNRRWVRRPDRVFADPFGVPNVRAHMHPGHESPDAVGPSGPVDPELSILAVQAIDGRPLALLANYSMHYYGSPLLSSDYYGRFAGYLGAMLDADDEFVAIMSQGTSGDLMWMDYGAPRKDTGYDTYAREIAEKVTTLVNNLEWQDAAPLRMAQRTLALSYRVPSPERLAWSKEKVAELEGRLPQSQSEIYALESVYLHEKQHTELVLQALRIGDLGITALPNEVYALTGLKLKEQSPFASTFNIELANGAEGYIPPPEQHALGGYTTWAARTAGLEVEAEPKIVEALLSLLEEVSGKTRRTVGADAGPYSETVLESHPEAYWRLEEMNMPVARDVTGQHDGAFEDGVALHLPGADERRGFQPPEPPTKNAFSGNAINRAVHFAGGRMRSDVLLDDAYSVEFWLWNGLPADARAVTGYAYSRGADGDGVARGEHLGIGGTHMPHLAGRLFLFNGNERNQILGGQTTLALRAWHHVVFVREGERVRVHLDGKQEPEIEGIFKHTIPQGENALFMGGRNDGLFNFEGKLDEISVYTRALTALEIETHYKFSDLTPPDKITATGPLEPALSQEEALKKIHVRDGYQVELIVSEPLTVDPVAIDWDASGRLWVVEMSDYPLGMDGQGKPGGRVRVIEDSDGDGSYDRQTLFADGLTYPTGLLVWRDGVMVTAAPNVLFLRDTDKDGRADDQEVLISGLSTGNQQLRANGLRWGIDGWVYCAAGGHHGNFANGTRLRTRLGEVQVGSRDFRFRPDTGELEPLSGPSQNGRNRDDWGHWFGTQNMRPLWHYVLPDRYLRRQPHVASPSPIQLVVTPLGPKVYPASSPEKRFHSFNEAGRFTSACGGMIYRDSLLFPKTGNQMHAFTCEPFHNLVQHNMVVDQGVSFAAHRDGGDGVHDFFASEDRWCRPVMTRTGPDGALWVVDMYRYMIEHPDWLPAAGRDELLPNYRIGDDLGRIYRVVRKDSGIEPQTKLDQLSIAELVEELKSGNGWRRDRAHMMLSWQKDQAVVGHVRKLAEATANPVAKVHALWLLNDSGGLTPDHIRTALKHSHPRVRENALRLAESSKETSVVRVAAELVNDPDDKVRLQLAFSLGEWDQPMAGDALGKLAVASADDAFMKAAVLSSATPHLRALAGAVIQSDSTVQGALMESLIELAFALNERDVLAELLGPMMGKSDESFTLETYESATAFFQLVKRRGSKWGDLTNLDDALGKLLTHVFSNNADSIVNSALKTVKQDSASVGLRAAAIRCVGEMAEGRSEVVDVLVDLLTPQQPISIQEASLEGLTSVDESFVAAKVLDRWASFSPSTRAKAMQLLLSRESWTIVLLERLVKGQDIPLDALQRERLMRHGSIRVRELASQMLATPSDRAQVIEQFRPALRLGGDADRGRSVYERACALCHRKGNQGKEVGPDLNSVVRHSPEKLLANILDPSADIQPGYHAYQCELTNHAEMYGVITSETGNSLTMKLADGTEHVILRRDIRELRGGNLSLMPEGLERGLTQQDMADLIQWLRTEVD